MIQILNNTCLVLDVFKFIITLPLCICPNVKFLGRFFESKHIYIELNTFFGMEAILVQQLLATVILVTRNVRGPVCLLSLL